MQANVCFCSVWTNFKTLLKLISLCVKTLATNRKYNLHHLIFNVWIKVWMKDLGLTWEQIRFSGRFTTDFPLNSLTFELPAETLTNDMRPLCQYRGFYVVSKCLYMFIYVYILYIILFEWIDFEFNVIKMEPATKLEMHFIPHILLPCSPT